VASTPADWNRTRHRAGSYTIYRRVRFRGRGDDAARLREAMPDSDEEGES
jgi:hypothetical protein